MTPTRRSPPFNIFRTNTISDDNHGQEDPQPSECEHDSNSSGIPIKLETETESPTPQQLAELSQTQSDPDYEQYWEQQRQKKLRLLGVCSSPQPQQLDELSPTQSDPDYEQYWEEQRRKREAKIKDDSDSDEEVIPDSQEDVYLVCISSLP